MEPYQSELLTMVVSLLAMMTVAACVSAYSFRRIFSLGFIALAFVATVVMIIIAAFYHETNDPVVAFLLAAGLGATIGADLGGFTIAVTEGRSRGREAVFVTLAILAILMLVAAGIGILSGYNFQGLGGVLFMLLLGILGVSIVMLFAKLGKIVEMAIGLGVSAFFFVYMIYDFNQIVDLYEEATWGAALQIALGIFLDLVNIFVRLLPIIVEILDAMD